MPHATTQQIPPSLADLFRQIDAIGMSAADRSRAKESMRRADAIADVTARAWRRVLARRPRLRAAPRRSVEA